MAFVIKGVLDNAFFLWPGMKGAALIWGDFTWQGEVSVPMTGAGNKWFYGCLAAQTWTLWVARGISLQAGWRRSGQKGTKEASACSDWVLQDFRCSPHSLKESRGSRNTSGALAGWTERQKFRNSVHLHNCSHLCGCVTLLWSKGCRLICCP